MSHPNFKNNLIDTFTNQKFCDVTFTCKNEYNTWEKIGGHKCILAMASDIFAAIFYGKDVQTGAIKNEEEIKIEDVRMPIFKLLLEFIYHKDIEFYHLDFIGEFYGAADKYICKDARQYAQNLMIKDLNVHNSVRLYEIAIQYPDLLGLKEACLKVFKDKTLCVLKTYGFLKASPNTIKTIFELEPLKINSETDLVTALEDNIDQLKTDDPQIAEKYRPAINSIRFLTLILEEIEKTSLLTDAEKLSVIERDLSTMPPSLSVNQNKRASNRVEPQPPDFFPLFPSVFLLPHMTMGPK